MKIIFICGSLEEGKDGVADYTRRLSGELIRKGNSVKIIAIADRFISQDKFVEELQNDENTTIPVIRVSSQMTWDRKIEVLKPFIQELNPDWISLQYVPYTFHKKGLPFGLANKLKELAKDAKWHIMFHEMWVGISRVSPWKHRIVGLLQRQIAKSVAAQVNVKVMCTSNRLYQKVLENAGISPVSILPLFSSLPIADTDIEFSNSILTKLEIEDKDRKNWILAAIFGNLYPEANLSKILADLRDNALQEQKKLAFIGFGRMNDAGKKEFKRLENLLKNEIRFLYLGEQSQTHVSLLLQMLNYGISCTPAQHIGKSSVYAAMRMHGLEVLLPNYDYLPEYDKIIKEYQTVLEKRTPYEWSVDYIASGFTELLLNN